MAWVFSVACLLIATQAVGQDAAPKHRAESLDGARQLVHILDYVAQDYPKAVSDGRIANADEYREMVSFGRDATSLVHDLSTDGRVQSNAELDALVGRFQSGIAAKAPADSIAYHARQLRIRVLEITGLPTAPIVWPDLADARGVYETACVACHGQDGKGNGRVADRLDPKPTNFVEGDRIASQSPFQIYNTIRLGVEGTAMPDFQVLSEKELWKLAFFVKALRYSDADVSTTKSDSLVAGAADVSLEQIAALNDRELANALMDRGLSHPSSAVAAIRTGRVKPGHSASLNLAKQLLGDALAKYRDGKTRPARADALRAYLEGVEPIEPALAARDGALKAGLERRMLAVRNQIERGADSESVAQAVTDARGSLDEAERVLGESPPSLFFSFILAASILLREGLEAFLVILAILGVLRSVGQKEAVRWVHAGWMFALGLGIVAWFFSDALIQVGAAQREIMEGFVSLIAVGVLLYVGFWMHNKSEINKWKAFIEKRVNRTLGTGNLFGLAAISFFAVFREAFESVLFLSALTLEQGTAHRSAVAGGAAAAIAGVLILSAILLRYSIRLPSARLFKYSSAAVGILGIVLAGKGIHAFQEAGFLSMTPTPFSFRFELLGMYATIETLATQIVLLVVVLILWHAPKYIGLRTAVS
ncbi:MAG: FTR1 family protein [Rhodothermales bacterium]